MSVNSDGTGGLSVAEETPWLFDGAKREAERLAAKKEEISRLVQEALAKGQGPLDVAGALFNAQFEIYMGKLLRGDLGPSYRFAGRSVNDILFAPPQSDRPVWESRMGTTAFLGLLAMGWSMGQWLSLPMIVGGVVMLVWAYRSARTRARR